MSTRSNVHFKGYGKVVANVYVHTDGYPEHAIPRLYRFFDKVKDQTTDTRFQDASYLASKFVVYMALYEVGRDPMRPLHFLSLGITDEDAGDGEYVYEIDCEKRDAHGLPVVTARRTADDRAFDVEPYRGNAKAGA